MCCSISLVSSTRLSFCFIISLRANFDVDQEQSKLIDSRADSRDLLGQQHVERNHQQHDRESCRAMAECAMSRFN